MLAFAQKHDSSLDEAQVTVALNQVDMIWEQLFPKEQTRILQLLIEKIIVTPDNLDIRLRDNGIEALALELIEPASKDIEHERV